MYKTKSYDEFIKFVGNKTIKLSAVELTNEQLVKIIKPIMCDICRRIFNPTDEERKQLKESLKTLNDVPFEWEIIKNNQYDTKRSNTCNRTKISFL